MIAHDRFIIYLFWSYCCRIYTLYIMYSIGYFNSATVISVVIMISSIKFKTWTIYTHKIKRFKLRLLRKQSDRSQFDPVKKYQWRKTVVPNSVSTLWEAADWHWDNLGAIWQTESKTMQCYEKNNEITAASRLLHESDFTRIPLFVMIWNMHSNNVNQNDNSWHQMLAIIQKPKENAKLKCCQKGAPY